MNSTEFRREGKLSDGMVIVATVRARLFGLQLLELNADVTVSPTPPRLTARRPTQVAARRSSAGTLSPSNGSIGVGLDGAARSLEATASELTEARRWMP